MACPICRSDDVAETLMPRDLCTGSGDALDYNVCGVCGSVYIVKFPADIARYYRNYYSFDEKTPTIERSRAKRVMVAFYAAMFVRTGIHRWLRGLFRCPSPWQMQFLSPNLQAFLFLGATARDRILDVGSGGGEFVKMMRRFGYASAVGIDPFLVGDNPYVQRGELADATGPYDVILFNHSLEHMTDLQGALDKCASMLARRGTVVVHIPNLDSREFAAYKQDWAWMHAPFHFAIPSRRGLERMAKKAGLRITDKICTSRGDHYLYSEEYRRGIGDHDPRSARRQLEAGTFDRARYRQLATLAHSLNRGLTGDWIAYYLERA